jgi:HTH-type transcriptional regulator/antitoxin HigA
MKTMYIPTIPVHPGETLQEMLESLPMTQFDLANRTGLTPKTINEIVQGKSPISSETAAKFAAVFGMSVGFWSNLQRVYEAALEQEREREQLKAETKLLKGITCFSELVKCGYVSASIKTAEEQVKALLGFFGVSSLERIPLVSTAAFRRSEKRSINPYNLAAWLRCGELAARKIATKPFDRELLVEYLKEIRALTGKSPKEFVPLVRAKCAECGVAVVFVPHFKNTSVNGATRWLTPQTALVQLSLRYAYEDIFWFTFFHEFGHILKHGKKEEFVDVNGIADEVKEREADSFSSECLIPSSAYAAFKKVGDFSPLAIRTFAQTQNIAPAIVAGRLGRETGQWHRWASIRRKFEFEVATKV